MDQDKCMHIFCYFWLEVDKLEYKLDQNFQILKQKKNHKKIMETPKNKRTRRRSSLSSSANRSRNSIDTSSASKIVKTLILKDKLRKQNQYKTAKAKRAQLYEKKRHIDDIDLDDTSNSLMHSGTHESTQLQNITLDLVNDSNIEVIEKQEEKPTSNTGISSKLSSSIARRLNSFKNTIKNIVSNSNNNNKDKDKENKYKLHTQKSFKSSTVSLHEVGIKQEKVFQAPILLKPPTEPSCKVRRSISMTNFGTNKTRPGLLGSKILKKQDSLSSCGYNPVTSSTMLSSSSKNSTYSSTNSLSMRSLNSNCNQGKPAFKVSKIKYNDSHLYRPV